MVGWHPTVTLATACWPRLPHQELDEPASNDGMHACLPHTAATAHLPIDTPAQCPHDSLDYDAASGLAQETMQARDVDAHVHFTRHCSSASLYLSYAQELLSVCLHCR